MSALATKPRIGELSMSCVHCGWLLPEMPAAQFCARCKQESPDPMTLPDMETVERLYLAALVVTSELDRVNLANASNLKDLDAWKVAFRRFWLSLMVDRLTSRLQPGSARHGRLANSALVNPPLRTIAELPPLPRDLLRPPTLPLGTPQIVMREWLSRLAKAWRADKCSI